jgi:hypothetical protein
VNAAVVARLVELAGKATPTPWDMDWDMPCIEVDGVRVQVETECGPNAYFLVAAVNAVVPLAEDWTRLNAENEMLDKDLKAAIRRKRAYEDALRQIVVAGEVKTGAHGSPSSASSNPQLVALAGIARAALDLKEEPLGP